ncbi:hypothetical protein J6590_010182 [Homalodisca vitripennis]|nr:hypothetical protein J6590_010182 [Homalodisca vitripennis]
MSFKITFRKSKVKTRLRVQETHFLLLNRVSESGPESWQRTRHQRPNLGVISLLAANESDSVYLERLWQVCKNPANGSTAFLDSKLRHNKGRGQDVLYFKFSEKLTRNRVQSALLWIHVRGVGAVGPGPSLGGAPVTITVLRVLRGPEWTETPLSNIISTKVLRQNDAKGSWVSLDVRKLLEYWFQAPSENLGIVIQASGPPDPLGRTLIVTDLNEADGEQVPFLEVYVSDGRRHRAKRTLGYDCHDNSEETRCCRYPLTVDFEAFGWDWIIAPKKYEANYCSGECPYVFLQKYPHTHVADMARPPGSAGPCCAPRKLSGISMLYFDPTLNIIYGKLPSMVVDRCGCS